MLRILTIFTLLCMATSVSYAASQRAVQLPDAAKPTLSLRTEPVLYRSSEFSLKSDLGTSGSLQSSRLQAEYSPAVNYDFDGWFKSNATTIAIVALAVILLIIIAN